MVNVQNKTGQTALHMAVEYDYYAIVQALIAAGADEALTNNDGCEARTGIEGKKCLQLLAFSAATNAEELMTTLKALVELIDTDDKQLIDKVMVGQIGLRHKKVRTKIPDMSSCSRRFTLTLGLRIVIS